ncbi:hypothetical protein Cadr_000017968 [Camelus dromedarius]|uniref:Uncharacterized protein n=1 Tax=Camelus dromedarius TaxID=9838 RepID=A0A5N4D801_CAMDR|nr:hypothetical protein Cadr_000017968 [Camelus dromedarius]
MPDPPQVSELELLETTTEMKFNCPGDLVPHR